MSNHILLPMPGQMLAAGVLTQYLLAAAVAFFAYILVSELGSPLRRYPGPFLARFTNLWRLYYISRGSFQHDVSRLHKRYGPVVRIAPNVLDVDDPSLLKTVFGTKGDWKKTGYYDSASALINGHIVHNIFSQPDEDKHAAEKKPVAKYYTPTGVLTLEPLIDKTIAQLCKELDTRFTIGSALSKPFDLGSWILYYAWDVIGTATFSAPFGYLSAGRDFDGTLLASESLLDYFAWVGCIPVLDRLLQKNNLAQWIRGPAGFSALAATCVERLIARYSGTENRDPTQPDYLDRFIAAKEEDTEGIVDDNQIVSWIMVNMGPGADTTAITIRSALYYSLKTPGAWERLEKEVLGAGWTPGSVVSLKEARKLPYLEGVVREAIRYLPGVSLGLERFVPAGGQKLSLGKAKDATVPEGTILAFNPWIINRNREVWGDDSYEFRPERWLKADGESQEAFSRRLRAMNDTDLSFGAGSRICIGKNMGVMQAYKVVATLVLNYEIELVHPEREWTVINSWFPRQEGLEVRMKKRVV